VTKDWPQNALENGQSETKYENRRRPGWAGAYQEAVTMSDEQRALNFAKLDRYVSKYTRYVSSVFQGFTIMLPFRL
jgi:hypothetical protein